MTEKKEKKKRKFSDIFSKYKTYDTSEGLGNSENWKESFKKRIGDKEETKIKYFIGCDTEKQRKDKYRELMKQYHPDVAGNTEENNRISKEISEEYNNILKKLK